VTCGTHVADSLGGYRRHAGRAPQILEVYIAGVRGAPRRFSRRLSQTMRGAPRAFSRRLSPTCWVRPADSRDGYRRHAGRALQICEAGIAGTEGAVRKVARVSFSSNMRLRLADLRFLIRGFAGCDLQNHEAQMRLRDSLDVTAAPICPFGAFKFGYHLAHFANFAHFAILQMCVCRIAFCSFCSFCNFANVCVHDCVLFILLILQFCRRVQNG
jgi:hypothetical protein